MSAPATPHMCPRCTSRSLDDPVRRSARRWIAGSLVLAAASALVLFWLLAKPVALHASSLGFNYVEISARIGTAGMPTRTQIGRIAAAGYNAVINLAPSDSLGSHVDEAALVGATGMSYEHLPVDFAQPTAADYAQFALLMKKHGGSRVFVHCQINMRASVFVYLYRVLELGEDPDRAYDVVRSIWQPTHQWRELIRELHAARGRPLPFDFD